MCGATSCEWATTTQVWRMSLRGSCLWRGLSSTGTTGLAAMTMTSPWSGCGAEKGTVSPSITTFCLSACPTGERGKTSTGKPASSLAGETQVSGGVLRGKRGRKSAFRSLCGPLIYVNSRLCSHCSHCLCQHMVLRNGEMRWVLCCCVFIWFWGLLTLLNNIPLKLWERPMLSSAHSPLFLLTSTLLTSTEDP